MKKLILFMFLLYGNVWGTIHTIATVDMPYTALTSYGAADTIRPSEDLTYAGAGAMITIPAGADSVTFDFNGYNITFGSNTDTNTVQGIHIQSDYVLITGNSTDTLKTGWDYNHYAYTTRCIWADNVKFTRIENITVLPSGYAGSSVTDWANGNHGIVFTGAGQFMNSVVNANVHHLSNGFYYRQYYTTCAILFGRGGNLIDDSQVTDTATMYIGRVDSSNIIAEHIGIFFYGSEGLTFSTRRGMYWGSDNTIKMSISGVNDWAGTGYRYGDGYAITARGCNGIKFENNTIYSDTSGQVDANGDTLFGGQGIFVDGCNPTNYTGWFNKVRNNTITVATGDEGGNHSTGIHTRSMARLLIDSNVISVAADSNGNGNSTPWRSAECNGIWVGFNATEAEAQDSVLMRWNTINAEKLVGGTSAYDFRFRGKGDQWYWETSNNILNVTDGSAYFYMGDDSANGINSYGDSVTSTGYTFDWYSWSAWSGLGEESYDLKFVPADSADTSINTASSGNKELSLFKTIDLTVSDTNSLPISNAVCSLFLSNDTMVGLTNASGIYTDTLLYYYVLSSSSTEERYDPITIKVVSSDGADSIVISSYGLMGISGDRDTTVVLNATEGAAVNTNKRKYQGITIRGVK